VNDSIKKQVSSKHGIDQCVRDMHKMLEEHGFMNVEIKRGHRSLSQNALYWIWVKEIAEFINAKKGTDFTSDEIHTKLKADFLGFEPARKIGSTDIPQQVKSTKKLTKGEMLEYLQQIEAWCAGFGLVLPRPSDSQYEQLMRMNR